MYGTHERFETMEFEEKSIPADLVYNHVLMQNIDNSDFQSSLRTAFALGSSRYQEFTKSQSPLFISVGDIYVRKSGLDKGTTRNFRSISWMIVTKISHECVMLETIDKDEYVTYKDSKVDMVVSRPEMPIGMTAKKMRLSYFKNGLMRPAGEFVCESFHFERVPKENLAKYKTFKVVV